MRPDLRLVDDNGEVTPEGCPRCAESMRRAAGFEEDLRLAEQELRQRRAQIAAFKKDREKERQLSAHRAAVERVWQLYVETLNKPAMKLDGSRFDVIERTLKLGYELEHFRLAFLGAKHDPFTTKRANGTTKRHDGIELVCRSAEKFEEFCNKGVGWPS